MGEKRVEIYGLFERDTGELRYIGKANNSEKRFKSHLRDARRRNTPVYCWIRARLTNLPVVRVLSVVDGDKWQAEERRLIHEARLKSSRLLNLADGGEQPSITKEQNSKNGHSLCLRLKSDPSFAELRRKKCLLGRYIYDGFVSNVNRAKLRKLAQENPKLFGTWLNLKDREENEDGTPKQLHRYAGRGNL
jgi:hypothetical protein